jgi:hypothetical protein
MLTAVGGACDDGGSAPASTPAGVASTPTAALSPTPEPSLAGRIGVRGDLPSNEPIELAARYGLTDGEAPASKPFAGEANVGDAREFFVQRINSAAFSGDAPPDTVTITATVAAKSQHAYFYVDDALGANAANAQAAADAFEDTVWPAITGVFGTPLTPGVDGDPRIIVLQADLGGAVGGYVSPDDGFLRAVRPQSNEAEMVYMDRTLLLGNASFNVVLAHELQHLIHGNVDAGEEAWINEGLSEAASGVVGGGLSSIASFAVRPDIQLNTWGSEGSAAHYGASAAFNRYLAHRFGGDSALGDIARAGEDGARGVEEFLDDAAPELTFREVFADWITANVLDRVEGPYSNPGDPVEVRVEHVLELGQPIDEEATQFGTDYYLLPLLEDGEHIVRFKGASDVSVLSTTPPDGGAMYWSNAQDDVNTRLTRELDLSDTTSPTLTFDTWFDIESWYDWGYVSVSADDGATWRALAGTHATSDDPAGAAYGAGYTGASGGDDEPAWVEESISLAEFAGERILLRFEYVTDGSTYGEGWAIDNVVVSEAGFEDLESDDGGWDEEGWVTIDEQLPQSWVVRLIAESADGAPVIVDADIDRGTGELRFDATGLQDVVLAIAGATEGTTQVAPYTVELTRP